MSCFISGTVNNAGGQFAAPAESFTPNGFRSVIDLNLTGTFLMMRAAYDLWMKAHGGSIVTVLAMVGRLVKFSGIRDVDESTLLFSTRTAGTMSLTALVSSRDLPHNGRDGILTSKCRHL